MPSEAWFAHFFSPFIAALGWRLARKNEAFEARANFAAHI
jgi:hypothetical protein